MRTLGRGYAVGVVLGAALVASALAAQVASAAITPTADADALAQAIVAQPGTLAPPSSLMGTPLLADVMPNATSDSALAGFPTNGGTYAILTSGDPEFADDPNTAEDTGFETWDDADPNKERLRGDTDFDVSVLGVKVNVPDGANCLALDYRFLSDEFPEFVGTQFNDAFIAEVDNSTWTTSATSVLAPSDFATDTSEEGVTVNGVGPVAVTPIESSDTTYDAATGLVTSKTPISTGAHTIFLSIFDQGDHRYDSAAFVDNLRFLAEDPSTCRPPFVAQIVPPPPAPPAPPSAPTPPPPSNDFSIPGSSVTFKNGSTTITIVLPGPGTVSAGQAASASTAAKKKKKKRPVLVKSVRKVATKAGPVKLTIKPTRAGKKVLRHHKQLTVRMKFTFTPTGGTAKSTIKKITIKKTVKPKRKKH